MRPCLCSLGVGAHPSHSLFLPLSIHRKMKNPPARTGKPRTPPRTMAKVSTQVPLAPAPHPSLASRSLVPTDGLAYSALLKNELLGAGIEKVQDPQTEDRRLQPSTPERKGLFTVSPLAAAASYTALPGAGVPEGGDPFNPCLTPGSPQATHHPFHVRAPGQRQRPGLGLP